jgi:predicted ester cyclase
MEVPPTGNRTRVSGITINRTPEVKMVEDWDNRDTVDLKCQLGLIPEPR